VGCEIGAQSIWKALFIVGNGYRVTIFNRKICAVRTGGVDALESCLAWPPRSGGARGGRASEEIKEEAVDRGERERRGRHLVRGVFFSWVIVVVGFRGQIEGAAAPLLRRLLLVFGELLLVLLLQELLVLQLILALQQPWAVKLFSCRPVWFIWRITNEINGGA
jgi:hypothetical protein